MKVTVNHAYNGELRTSTVEAKEMFISVGNGKFDIRELPDGSIEIAKRIDESINITAVSKWTINVK